MCVITIPGKPIAWKRPGRSGNIYYDTQLGLKNMARWHMRRKWPKPPSKQPIELSCMFMFPMPKSWPKGKRKAMRELPEQDRLYAQDPDIDNLFKMYSDCGQGILWENDNQIVKYFNAGKYWAEEGSTIITFREIGNEYLDPSL